MGKQISHPFHHLTKDFSISAIMHVIFLDEIFGSITLVTSSALNHAILISFYHHIHKEGFGLFLQMGNLNLKKSYLKGF